MSDKPGFIPGSIPPNNGALPYPGPPEYVEQGFPMQPSYPPPPMAVQTHGMHMPYGMPPPAGYPAGYPPPIMQQPLNPMGLTEGFYAENAPPPPLAGTGDPRLALEYLKTVTSLQIRQKIEMLEIFTGFETENRYVIYNELNQPVFYAMECSDCCARQCCGPQRPMEMRIVDVFQTEVIHLHRPLMCQSCCCPCCLQMMEVSSPPGAVVGTIEQQWSLWPKFEVKDAVGNTALKIEGPFFTCSCGKDVNFNVITNNGLEIGAISKKWSGFAQEYFTDADNFGVNFPEDLDVTLKAALLGAVFLIDMMYMENPQKKQNNRPTIMF